MAGVTVKLRRLLDPQLFVAVTEIMPPPEPGNTVIEVVPWPETSVQPGGINQVYMVAPGTGAML